MWYAKHKKLTNFLVISIFTLNLLHARCITIAARTSLLMLSNCLHKYDVYVITTCNVIVIIHCSIYLMPTFSSGMVSTISLLITMGGTPPSNSI